MGYSATNIKPRTVIVLSIITVFVVLLFITYEDNNTANNVQINDTEIILTYPKKSITLDYKIISEVKISCADKGGGCGLVIYLNDKKYHTKYFTDSNNAKQLRERINSKIRK